MATCWMLSWQCSQFASESAHWKIKSMILKQGERKWIKMSTNRSRMSNAWNFPQNRLFFCVHRYDSAYSCNRTNEIHFEFRFKCNFSFTTSPSGKRICICLANRNFHPNRFDGRRQWIFIELWTSLLSFAEGIFSVAYIVVIDAIKVSLLI